MKSLLETFRAATVPTKIGFCIGIPVVIAVFWPALLFIGVVLIGVWFVASIGSIVFGDGRTF
jgi:hypothetical protein